MLRHCAASSRQRPTSDAHSYSLARARTEGPHVVDEAIDQDPEILGVAIVLVELFERDDRRRGRVVALADVGYLGDGRALDGRRVGASGVALLEVRGRIDRSRVGDLVLDERAVVRRSIVEAEVMPHEGQQRQQHERDGESAPREA